MPGGRKAGMGFIFITILIDVMGMGIIIPVIPDLIQELTGEKVTDASIDGGLLFVSYAAMQFLFSPFLGELSDRWGRRPILLAAMLGLSLDYLFHAYAPTLTWLFVGRLMAGMTGANFAVATAYIADISTKENKAQNFGMIGAAFGVGFIIGPALGGLLGELGTRVPFLAAAGLSFLNFLYGFFILPESLPKEKRRKFNFKQANPIGALRNINKYHMLGGLLIGFFILFISHQSVQATWVFYTKYKFSWDKSTIGLSLAIVGLVYGVVEGVLVRIAVKRWGEKKTIYVGLAFTLIGMFLMAFATNTYLLFAYIVPWCLGGLASPTLEAMASNSVPENEQGNLSGTIHSLISLSSIIGPLAMNGIFYYFSSDKAPIHFPGAHFLAGGILVAVAIFFISKSVAKLAVPKKA